MIDGPVAAARPVSAWNIANALTVARILLVPVYGVLLLRDDGTNSATRIAAFVVFLVAMLTDRLDGDLARRRGLITDVGKILDPIADKALLGVAFVGLSLLGEVPWWVTVVVLVREVGITLLRFVVIRHGVMPAGRGGKLKTVLQTVALSLLTLPLREFAVGQVVAIVAYAVLAVAVVITVWTGIDYLVKAERLRQTSERTARRRAERAARRGRG